MKHVVWAEETNRDAIETVGGKGANLAEMTNAGLPVPPAFIVTAGAFEAFIEHAGLADDIRSALEDLDVEDNEALTEASEAVQELILSAGPPKEIEQAIRDAYSEISQDTDADVAVRSSATAEDLPEASFAGQQDTYLHVRGADSLVEHVQRCWASLYTPRAIYYRVNNDFPHEKVHMAVVVQRMVDAETSGVMMTRHPTTGASTIIIEAAWGLGEGVVSGTVSPDHYVCDREGNVLEETIATKSVMIVPGEDGTGVQEVEVPEAQQDERVLSDDQIEQLVRLARTLEAHYDAPQDVEWSFEDGVLQVLQTRPITTIKREEGSTDMAENETEEEGKVLIKGLGAAPGIGAGEVAQLTSAKELDRCQEGDVLVTTMTTPDMVPAMRRASAIVTDEGGMTCFPGETRVLTDQGLMRMDEIRERLGEAPVRALSIDPKTLEMSWQPILASMHRQAPVIEVSTSQQRASTSNTLRLTPDHKMMILDGTRLTERPIEDVVEREQMLTVADRIPAAGTVGRWPIPPYLAGALFTDGHWRTSERRGAVEFIQKETPEKAGFIDTVRAGFEGPLGVTAGERTVSGSSKIQGHAFESESLRLYTPRREPARLVEQTFQDIDTLVLRASTDELEAFLAGVADGDGTFEGPQGTRLQIYAGDEHLTQAIVLACLRLGIQPTVSPNRAGCVNIQLREGLDGILERSERFDPPEHERTLGTKLLPARQVLGDRIEDVNPGGRMKPYVERNLLLDARKLERALDTVEDPDLEADLRKVLDAPVRSKRVRLERELGVQAVYNLTVQRNHNYVVFTDQLTPVLVANCHAAIVSRELGVPCVVGTKTGTEVLTEGLGVTVDGDKGTVAEGISTSASQEAETEAAAPSGTGAAPIVTATEVKVNISMPEATERAVATNPDGVGLLRVEHIVLGLGEHPMEMIEDGRDDAFVDYLVDGIETVARAMDPRPVWVRTLDAPTDEFRQLPGGEREPHEANPMLGWRGIRRDLDQPRLLAAELRAIKRLREDGFTNVGVMLPLVQHPKEIREAKRIAREVGLDPDEPGFDFGIMIEVPAAALIIDEMLDEGLDFVSFGTNDLTQYTLAVDRNNENVAPLFDEFHPALGRLIKMVIEACNERGVQSSICGQAGSDPRFVKKLIAWGISSVSANIDAVARVRQTIAREEQRMLLDQARDANADAR